MKSLRPLAPSVTIALLAAALCAPAFAEDAYDPKIDPAEFTTEITHPLFNLPNGKTMVFESKSEDGEERIEIRIRGETREVMGVKTLVYSDRVFLNGQLKEETSDYLAQDRAGNVWYFGEEVDNYEKGKFKDHHGAWLAGVDGAKPGIWMTAKQEIGREYRQEYYKGEAEDWAKVVATDASVKVPAGSFENCTKILEWTPLEPDAKAHKYYCPETGSLVLEEELPDNVRVELINLKQ